MAYSPRLSDKGEASTAKMAMTFRALTKLADFGVAVDGTEELPEEPVEEEPLPERQEVGALDGASLNLRHDIHLHLPASDDVKVYDAIFRSLRSNLLP
jgi:hypothetical protein